MGLKALVLCPLNFFFAASLRKAVFFSFCFFMAVSLKGIFTKKNRNFAVDSTESGDTYYIGFM